MTNKVFIHASAKKHLHLFLFYFYYVYEKVKVIRLKKYIRHVRKTRKTVQKKRMLKEKLGKARGKNTSQACESWATIVHH